MSEPRDPAPPLTRVEIDLNIRSRGNKARVSYEDADGPLTPGQTVTVYETETGLAGTGTVSEADDAKRLAWIDVDWTQLQPGGALHADQVFECGREAGTGRPVVPAVARRPADEIVSLIDGITSALNRLEALDINVQMPAVFNGLGVRTDAGTLAFEHYDGGPVTTVTWNGDAWQAVADEQRGGEGL